MLLHYGVSRYLHMRICRWLPSLASMLFAALEVLGWVLRHQPHCNGAVGFDHWDCQLVPQALVKVWNHHATSDACCARVRASLAV